MSDEVIVRVVSQKGTCHAGLKAGDEFTVGLKTPAGFCTWALCALFPAIEMLRFGGSYPWSEERKSIVACPDPDNPVVFELRPKP